MLTENSRPPFLGAEQNGKDQKHIIYGERKVFIMTGTATGLITGIAVGLIVVFFALRKLNDDGKAKTKYDERQKAVRGMAYTYGFWTMLAANAIMLVLSTTNFDVAKLGPCLYFLPIFAGIVVQVSYSIFNDGYVGLNTNMKKYTIFMIIVTVFNIGVALLAFINGKMFTNGRLQGPFLNLLCGLLFFVVAVDLLIKQAIDRREA